MATYAFDDSWFYGASQGTLCSGPSLWYTNDPCQVVTARPGALDCPRLRHPSRKSHRPQLLLWSRIPAVGHERSAFLPDPRKAHHGLPRRALQRVQPRASRHRNSVVGSTLENTSLISGINTDAYTQQRHQHLRIAVPGDERSPSRASLYPLPVLTCSSVQLKRRPDRVAFFLEHHIRFGRESGCSRLVGADK